MVSNKYMKKPLLSTSDAYEVNTKLMDFSDWYLLCKISWYYLNYKKFKKSITFLNIGALLINYSKNCKKIVKIYIGIKMQKLAPAEKQLKGMQFDSGPTRLHKTWMAGSHLQLVPLSPSSAVLSWFAVALC